MWGEMDLNHRPLSFDSALTLSYRPRKLSDQRQAGRHLPDRSTIGGRLDPDCHGLAIAFRDQDVFDSSLLELALERQQVLLISSVQSDCNSVQGNSTRRRFPSSVDDLSYLLSMREVSSYHYVVNQIGFGVAIAGLPNVNDSRAWVDSAHAPELCQAGDAAC